MVPRFGPRLSYISSMPGLTPHAADGAMAQTAPRLMRSVMPLSIVRKFGVQTPADYGKLGKSRSPGSSPGRTPLPMESPPLRRFLRSLGRVQHHLHTVVVGLAAIEAGIANKPDDLDISWEARDPVGSAREARRFLLRSTLVLVAEELKEYATQVLKYQGQALPEDRADRLRSLGPVDPSYLAIAPLVVSHWRNRIVHRRSHGRLTAAERESLTSQSPAIRDSFKHLDAARLLKDLEADQPTLKDVTVLIAMSIRFVRFVDARLLEPSTAVHVRMWLEAEGLLDAVLRLEKESRNGGSPDPRGRAKRYLVTEAPSLAEVYYALGAA